MNTKSFRREILIGVGGFVAGVALSAMMSRWTVPRPGVVVRNIGASHNHIANINLPHTANVSFENEFGLLTGQAPKRVIGPLPKPLLFDLPRQQPWVAPYEFLIQPVQKH